MTDADGRKNDRPRLDGYTISSPCEPNGSGELKKLRNFQEDANIVRGNMKPCRKYFLSIYAPYHFQAEDITHVHYSLNNFYNFRNLPDTDFALSCMDVPAINAKISIY